MNWIGILMYALGFSMDAFAVAVCKGLAVEKPKLKHYLIVGAWFGGFQALMPTVGYFFGSSFERFITAFDHWVAFALLLLIGINMMRESLSKDEEKVDNSFGFKAMLVLAIATSIDALVGGISIALDQEQSKYIIPTVITIGCTTFALSALGLKIGNVFGDKYKSKAEFVGGVILILLGAKVLLTDLGVIG